MKKAYIILIGLVLVMSSLLVACGSKTDNGTKPPATVPEMTQDEFEGVATDTTADLTQLGESLSESTLGQALQFIPAGLPEPVASFLEQPTFHSSLSAVTRVDASAEVKRFTQYVDPLARSDETLPRGTFSYNELTGEWDGTSASSGNLVMKWTYNDGVPRTADLTVDWDVTQPTRVVSDGHMMLEVPTDMNLRFSIDGATLALVDADATWFDGAPCAGAILEPSSMKVKGFMGDATGRVDMDLSFSLTDNVGGADTLKTKGDISATSGADSASTTWDLSLAGAVIRDTTCFLEDLTVTSGSVQYGLASTVDGDSDSLSLAFGFDNLLINEVTEETSVDLSNGVIKVDNVTAVTFQGRLDDANGNGVPGENVTLSFAGGETTTLEAFLENNMTKIVMAHMKARLNH